MLTSPALATPPLLLAAPAARQHRSLPPRLGAALAYAGFWVTGLYFLATSTDREVRTHAAQSVLIFGGLHALYLAVSFSPVPFRTAFLVCAGIAAFALTAWIGLLSRALRGAPISTPISMPVPTHVTERVAGWTSAFSRPLAA